MPTAIYFYDVVLAVHIASIVIAFGVTFAYPLVLPWLRSTRPEAMGTFHAIQGRIGQFLITPAGVLALISGGYMASDRDYFGETWVVVPLLILLILLAAGGLFFKPSEERLAELADRDMQAGGPLSPEYDQLAARVGMVGAASSALVLVAIFFMAAKPFA